MCGVAVAAAAISVGDMIVEANAADLTALDESQARAVLRAAGPCLPLCWLKARTTQLSLCMVESEDDTLFNRS